MSNIALYESAQGIMIAPTVNDVSAMMQYNKVLKDSDSRKIIQAVDNGLYDMVAEYVWSRTINILKKDIMQFGDEFVADMLDRPDVWSVDSISDFEIISLAADLGYINKTAKMEFLQYSETIQHYMSNEDPSEEYPSTKLTDMVRSCVKHVLGQDRVEYEVSFIGFRERLKTESINKNHPVYESLLQSPYFYIKTVTKTLLNLAKSLHDGAERENVFANIGCIFPAIWQKLSSDDRWSVGRTFVQANTDGDSALSKAISSVLIKTKGFDYIPENLRSNSYIKVAKLLLSTHFGIDNFYNESAPAKMLAEMGSSIPVPAFGSCITAVLACKLGNSYGHSRSAEEYLDRILDSVSPDRWSYYFSGVFPTDSVILYKLLSANGPVSRLKILTEKYEFILLDITDVDAKKIVQDLSTNNLKSVSKLSRLMYTRLNESEKQYQ